MTEQQLLSKTLNFESEAEAAEHFHSQGWTDGLPIVPPTQSAVESFLRYSGRSPAEIVLTEPVKDRVVTAEKVAANAVMAGCRPEAFPVVLAAAEAMDEPEFNLHAISASTMGAAVLIALFRDQIAAFFSEEAAVRGEVARYLLVSVWGYAGFGLFIMGNGALNAIDRAGLALSQSLARVALFMVPAALFLRPVWGSTGIYTAELAANVLGAALAVGSLWWVLARGR